MSDITRLVRSPMRPEPHESIVRQTANLCVWTNLPTGGARRDRTDDLLLAKQALSQLSYGPESRIGLPIEARGEPPDFALRLRRAIFSRFASEDWWAWEDLNFRPHAYQARALTN